MGCLVRVELRGRRGGEKAKDANDVLIGKTKVEKPRSRRAIRSDMYQGKPASAMLGACVPGDDGTLLVANTQNQLVGAK